MCMWPMYVVHFLGLTFSAQNLVMPSINSSFVWGLTTFRKKCFSSCQTNSIGLSSGDLGGVFYQLMLLSSMKVFAHRPVCFGSFFDLVGTCDHPEGFLDEGQQSIGKDLGYVVGISIQVAML